MPDHSEDDAPPSPVNKVEITVGGHTVVVESGDSLADVVGYAYGLHQQTSDAAKKIPMGFDVTGGSFERAPAYDEISHGEPWSERDAQPMEQVPARGGDTRRMIIPEGWPTGRAAVPVPTRRRRME